MKVIAILLLSLVAISSAQGVISKQMTKDLLIKTPDDNGLAEITQVVGGILAGAFGSYTSITACYSDSKDALTDFKNAYISLREGTFKGTESGLIHVGRALLKLPEAIKSCKDVTTIVEKIKKLAVYFSNPTLLTVNVGKNIIWHGRSIYKEVNTAIVTWNAKQYFSFGMAVGTVMDLVFLRAKHGMIADVNNDGTELLKGFAHGVSPSSYDDITECINDVNQETIDRLVADIKDLNWKHIERSVNDIQDIGQIFVGIVKDCKSGKEDVEQLVIKLAEAFNAGTFIKAALKIISNPIAFASLVDHIQKDIKNHKFFAAGDEVGTFVGEVIGTRMSLAIASLVNLS